MKRDHILQVFRNLAMSKGFYGRLLRDIENSEDGGDAYLTELENQNFQTDLDLILYIEG